MSISSKTCKQAIINYLKASQDDDLEEAEDYLEEGQEDLPYLEKSWKRREKKTKHDAFGLLAEAKYTMRIFEFSLKDALIKIRYATWDDGEKIILIKKLKHTPKDYCFYISSVTHDHFPGTRFFWICPIDFWEEKGHQYDGYLEFKLPELPFDADEAAECFFEWDTKRATAEQMHQALLNMGFVYREDFAKFHKECE